MNFSSIIFRLLAWGLLLASVALFFLNQESFISYDSKIEQSENLKKEANTALETDKNKSTDLINGMFRERGKLRLEIEETLANAEKLKEEAELILLKEKDLSERNSKLLKDLEKVRQDLAEQSQKIERKKEEEAPIQQELAKAEEELKELDEQNKKVMEFLLNETYSKFFGTVFSNVFTSSNMINPFIDLHFLNMLFNSKYSITNKRVFSKAPFGHFKSRQFYPKLIQKSNPEILKSAMDRGYDLEDFLYWYKYPKPILNYVKRKIQGKKAPRELNYLSLLNDKLIKSLIY